MHIDTQSDTFTLSTGREFYANGGIVGIKQGLLVFTGSDDSLSFNPAYFGDEHDEIYRWTPEEQVELADHMMALWQRFKTKALGGDVGACTCHVSPFAQSWTIALGFSRITCNRCGGDPRPEQGRDLKRQWLAGMAAK